MSRARLLLLVAALMAVSACSGSVSTVDEPGNGQTPSPSSADGQADDTASADDGDEGRGGEAPSEAGLPTVVDAPGLIATTDGAGLRLLTSDGEVQADLFGGDRMSQPTWSRDGAFLAATHVAAATGIVSVLTTQADNSDAATLTAADRGYFFYSWNSTGDRIAALGPGPRGTSLDILDQAGNVVSASPIDAGSLFVAWEPDGGGLLLNVDAQLQAVDDPTDLASVRPLGPAAVAFQAPMWLGERKALVVTGEFGPEPVLARLDVDTGDLEDLGPATSATFIVPSPDASAAVLVHGVDVGGEITSANFKVQPPEAITGAVELVDLATGARQRVSDEPAFWAEWSPDGSALLLGAAAADSLRWDLWSDGEVSQLTEFLPSQEFFDSYIRFAPAYLESPRLWSPDSTAITFGSTVDGDDVAKALVAIPGSDAVTIGESSVAFWSPSQSRS